MVVLKHLRGVEVEFGAEEPQGWLPTGAALPLPTAARRVKLNLEILQDGDGCVLVWTGPAEQYCNDSSHQSIDAAMGEATRRFGVDPDEWIEGADPLPTRTEAFAIVRPADSMIQEYLATAPGIQNRHLLDQLWAAIAPHDPRNYRGSGCILQGLGPPPPGSTEAEWLVPQRFDRAVPFIRASRALGSFTDDDLETGSLLFDAEQVRQVLSFAPPSGPQLGVVKVRCEGFVDSASILGFDVGYWGGDHYSTICDSIVTPTWHPPQPEDFEKLAAAVAALNQNLLFRTADAAAAWCARYKEFRWAETEGCPGEFAIIQIESVDASFRDHAR